MRLVRQGESISLTEEHVATGRWSKQVRQAIVGANASRL
jgi:hypothetical protein